VIRVFIVARSPAEQEQLRSRAASTDVVVVGAAESLDAAGAARADVTMFSDVDLLGNGASGTPARAIVWTDDEDAVTRVRRSALASWGVVARSASRSQLRAAIVAVGSGLCVMTPETAGEGSVETAEDFDEDGDRLVLDEPLTARERDVLDMASRGLSNREIGAALGISEHTAKFHLAAIYGKLGVSTRTAAVRRGLRRGIITI
jgi:two-component system, NarL family, nitrate/nitrite response regulator NarL